MKKLLAFLLGIMVMATMIAGCGGGGEKKNKTTATTAKNRIARPPPYFKLLTLSK